MAMNALSPDALVRFLSLSVDPLCIAAPDGSFKGVNPAFEQLLGYSAEDLLSTPFMAFMHPDDRARTEEILGAYSANVPVKHIENRYVARDGTIKWLSWTACKRSWTICGITPGSRPGRFGCGLPRATSWSGSNR